MSVHRWTSNDKAPGDGRWSFARRAFIHWGPEKNRHSAHVDVYLNRRHGHGWGFMLRLDGPTAETPIDAGLFLGRWAYVFAGTSLGRTLNRVLRVKGECAENGYQGGSRQIEFRLSVGDAAGQFAENALIEWHLWSDPDHSVLTRWEVKEMRKQHSALYLWTYRWFRRGRIRPFKTVLDAVLGKTVCTVVKSDPVPSVVCLPEGEYPVTVTLEQRTWRRPRSPRAWLHQATADVEVVPTSEGGPGYCPTGRIKYGDDDGTVSTCGGRTLTPIEAADPAKWVPIGIASFTESVLKDRARYRHVGYVPEHPTDREIAV